MCETGRKPTNASEWQHNKHTPFWIKTGDPAVCPDCSQVIQPEFSQIESSKKKDFDTVLKHISAFFSAKSISR